MGKNLNQVYLDNPASNIEDNDIFYLIRSPYGSTEDFGVEASVIKTYASNAGSTTLIYIDANAGSDITGNGTAVNPYATITHANSVISDNSAAKPYVLFLTGIFTETALAIKPWVSWYSPDNYATQLTVSGSGNHITLDASWAGTTSANATITNVTVDTPTNFEFDFSGMAGSFSNINLINVNTVGAITCNGRIDGNDYISLLSTNADGAVTVTDMSGSSYLTYFTSTLSLVSTNATAGIGWQSGTDQLGNVVVSETSGQSVQIIATTGFVNGSVTITGANAYYEYDSTTYPNAGFNITNGLAFSTNVAGINRIPIKTVTSASYAVLESDYVINVNRAGAVALTIPSERTGQTYEIKDTSLAAATNNITITPTSGNIEGAASLTINTNGGSYVVRFDGTNWWVY